MTRYELIKMNESLFKTLVQEGIEPKDVQYLPMVEEYRRMKQKKHKVSYIACFLSQKYNITERGVYKVMKRFGERVKV